MKRIFQIQAYKTNPQNESFEPVWIRESEAYDSYGFVLG